MGDQKLFGRKQYFLLGLAVIGGLSMNGYRMYHNTGTLDRAWFMSAAVTVVVAFTIFYFVARHANRPKPEERRTMDSYDRWSGLIPIVFGVYAILVAKGVLPLNPKDPQKLEEWREKFGSMMMIVGPAIIVFGIMELAGVL